MQSLFFYSVLFISKLISSAETSIIISSRLKLDLHFSSKNLGYLGLFTALGRALGSIAFSCMFKRDYVKQYLIAKMLLKALCFAVIFFQLNFKIILLSRIIVGMNQMFEMLFYPHWVDEYFEQRIWLTFFINIATPLGLVLGYLVSFSLEAFSWRKYFLILSLLSACSSLIIVLSSFKFHRRFQHNKKKSEEILQEAGTNINKKEFNTTSKLFESIYLLSVFGRTVLMFIFSFFQFWLNAYMTNVLIISNIKTIFITFTVLSFFCPILGILLENYISKEVIEKEKHLIIVMIASSGLISLLSVYLPFVNGINLFSSIIWVYFTLLSVLASILTTFSSNNSTNQTNSAKEAFSHAIINICGSGLGIFLYGVIQDKYNSKFPMHLFINISWLALICVCGICYLKWNTPEIEYPVRIDSPEPQTNPLRLTRTSDIIRGHDDDNNDNDNNLQDTISITDDDNMSKNDEDLFSISFHLQNQSISSSNKVIDFPK